MPMMAFFEDALKPLKLNVMAWLQKLFPGIQISALPPKADIGAAAQ
jgi:hypothetical protein